MTRKDYMLIAKVLKNHKEAIYTSELSSNGKSLLKDLMDALWLDNKDFKSTKFIDFIES